MVTTTHDRFVTRVRDVRGLYKCYVGSLCELLKKRACAGNRRPRKKKKKIGEKHIYANTQREREGNQDIYEIEEQQ